MKTSIILFTLMMLFTSITYRPEKKCELTQKFYYKGKLMKVRKVDHMKVVNLPTDYVSFDKEERIKCDSVSITL